MRISHAVVVGSLLVPSIAFAFRAEPSPDARPTEFGRPDFARLPDAARQQRLSASPAWQQFLADHPGPWRVTWDDRAGTPREITGATIPLVPASAGAAQVERAARLLLRELQPLSRVDEALLRTQVLRAVGDTWFVRFDRVTSTGLTVDGAYAELRVRAGRVVLLRLETHPLADGAAPAALSRDRAIARANAAIGAFLPGASLAASATAVVVPVAAGSRWEYRPAWKVESRARGRAGRWLTTVDALHGELLARESLVRWTVSGTVRGSVEPRTVGDTPVVQPLPYLRASVGGATVDANGAGEWTWGGDAPAGVTMALSGPYLEVRNYSGAEGSASFTASAASGNDFTWTTANATQSEIAGFRHAETARQWALGVVPDLAWLQSRLRVNVLIDSECNAYWDGESINFFQSGTDCNDTARIADVVYHEYGHGFHQNNLVSGTIDGAVGEGAGDFLAATITGSPLVGPYFFKDGDPVREIETDRVYPDDLVGEPHEDGLIWAGALWDLRKALVAEHGEAAGRALVDRLFASALATGPMLDQVYTEMLLADDDDGDLSNGTPNQCAIETAFGAHGLASSGAVFLTMHTPLSGEIDGLQPIAIRAVPPAAIGACGTVVDSVVVKYRVDGGATEQIALAPGANELVGALPAPGNGHLISYWMEVSLSSGASVTVPPGAPQYRFAFWTGPAWSVYREDFENGENGWTHGGTRDDWEVGTPTGAAGDPLAAFSGAGVLGNDLDGDGRYASDADNWAESPLIDCRGCRGARLRFRRWLGVEDGNWDRARVVVDGQTIWDNPVANSWSGPPLRDPVWSYEDFDISELADGQRFRLRFELSTDGALEFGGWTIDDVEVVSLEEPAHVGGGGDRSLWTCQVASPAATGGPGAGAALVALAVLLRRRKR